LLVQEKVTKANTPQLIAPSAHPALRVRASGRVPLKVRPCTQRNRRGHAPTPTGLIARWRRNAMGTKSGARCARQSRRHRGSNRWDRCHL